MGDLVQLVKRRRTHYTLVYVAKFRKNAVTRRLINIAAVYKLADNRSLALS